MNGKRILKSMHNNNFYNRSNGRESGQRQLSVTSGLCSVIVIQSLSCGRDCKKRFFILPMASSTR